MLAHHVFEYASASSELLGELLAFWVVGLQHFALHLTTLQLPTALRLDLLGDIVVVLGFGTPPIHIKLCERKQKLKKSANGFAASTNSFVELLVDGLVATLQPRILRFDGLAQ
jgi:hypothetical protein